MWFQFQQNSPRLPTQYLCHMTTKSHLNITEINDRMNCGVRVRLRVANWVHQSFFRPSYLGRVALPVIPNALLLLLLRLLVLAKKQRAEVVAVLFCPIFLTSVSRFSKGSGERGVFDLCTLYLAMWVTYTSGLVEA